MENGLMVGDTYSGSRLAGRMEGEAKQLWANLDKLQRRFDGDLGVRWRWVMPSRVGAVMVLVLEVGWC